MTLTNERQQGLIEWAEGYIEAAERAVENNPMDISAKAYLELLQVAHASLTADTSKLTELAAKVRKVREDASEFDGDRRGMWEHQEEQEQLLLEEAVKYTTPPVPVINIPDDDCVADEISQHYEVLSYSERRHITRMVLNEIKHLNGLGE